MASSINLVLLIVSISSLLSMSAQADLTFMSETPAAAPGLAFYDDLDDFDDLPFDAKSQMSRFIEASMILGSHKAEEYLKAIEKQVNDPATSETTLQCLKECQEVYQDALEDMKNTIEDMHTGNYYKANFDISAVSDNVDTCMECYKEMAGEDAETKNFDKWVTGIASDCLDKLGDFTS